MLSWDILSGSDPRAASASRKDASVRSGGRRARSRAKEADAREHEHGGVSRCYEGPLACLFVNFWKRKGSSIAPDTVIAKLVFARLDTETSSPFTYRTTLEKYDGEVHDGAVNGPATFLRIADMWKDLALKRVEVEAELSALATRTKTDVADAVKSASDAGVGAIKTAGDTGVTKFKEDIKSGFFGSFGWALAGFAIIVAAVTFVPWLQGFISPDLGKVLDRKVEEAVSKRLVIPSALQEAEAVKQRLAKVEEELRTVRAQQPASAPRP